jgi:hypothetical protein
MIKYDDLENAYLFVSSGQEYNNAAVVHRTTGEIFYQSDFTDVDEFPEDVDSEDYLSIPHKHDLDLGKELVFDFVAKYLPDEMAQVNQIFSSRGAYGRFKDFLDRKAMLDTWHQFEDEMTKKALRQWCADNGLDISE